MKGRNLNYLIFIAVLVAIAIWIVLPGNQGLHSKIGGLEINKPIEIRQGLDLQGGLQVLLEADLPESEPLTGEAMDTARTIVENRVNGLGVTEPVVQRQGDRRIIVELPGIQNPTEAIATLRETGLLEFIDAGMENLEEGTVVQTTFGQGSQTTPLADTRIVTEAAPITSEAPVTGSAPITPETPVTVTTPVAGQIVTETMKDLAPALQTTTVTTTAPAAAAPVTETASVTETAPITETAPVTAPIVPAETAPVTPTGRVYTTVMTGRDLESADVGLDEMGNPEISFKLKSDGARIFADYTTSHIGRVLAIVLDKEVISSPTIQSAIPDGSGRITGRFTLEAARSIAVQLRYGALPVPLRVETFRTIGPTLGQDSVARSIRAGTIGLIVVLLFMIIYYRLPGVLAACALIIYGMFNLAIYKWGIPTFQAPFFAPVTLTLPGITGFILSTGMAVDANILIFERMKEEIRNGRSLGAAIDAGFDRAWTSIRDSNLSTLITCVILYWFGSNFGASIVKGFAITLFIGVLISMFTAITVTRTFLRAVFDVFGEKLRNHRWLLGI